MAVGIQDSGAVPGGVFKKGFWGGLREQCQVRGGEVGTLGSELCQEDLSINLSLGISSMDPKESCLQKVLDKTQRHDPGSEGHSLSLTGQQWQQR